MLDISDNDQPIDTKQTSALLEKLGFPVAEASLTKMRCVGGGPEFLKFRRAVRYRPSAIKAWIAERTREHRNTSDEGQQIAA